MQPDTSDVGKSGAHGWQLILADLALILFLVTLSVLAARPESLAETAGEQAASGIDPARIAPSQALFRPGKDRASLDQWLLAQPRDPRATLTIFAEYTPNDREASWAKAWEMAETAKRQGVRVRVVIRDGSTSAAYASLAFDAPALQKTIANSDHGGLEGDAVRGDSQ